jgi:hypothetical protein
MRRGSVVSRPVAKSMIPAWTRGGSLSRLRHAAGVMRAW